MAETGTEYLKRLKQEAEHSPLLLMLEGTTIVAIALLAFLEIYVGEDGYPLISHVGYYGVVSIGFGWIVASTAAYMLAYAAYLRHYLRVLADGDLLVDLLDAGGTGDPGSFQQRIRTFAQSYHRLAAGTQAYPSGWRWTALATLAASIFYFIVLAGMLAMWYFGYNNQFNVDLNRLALFMFSLIVSLAAWMVLDRPRHIALRAALALALLRRTDS